MNQDNPLQVSGKIDVSGQIQMSAKNPRPDINNQHENWALIVFLPLLLFIFLFGFLFGIYRTNCFLDSVDIISNLVFWTIATVSIVVYSRFAFKIHGSDETQIKNNWQRHNQHWFNGVGAFVGWFALYILIFYRISGSDFSSWTHNLSTPDLILCLVSFFGITGHFPYASLLDKLR